MNLNQEFGFLFDLDGVLIDSCEFHWQAWDLLQKEVKEFKTSKEEFLITFGKRNDEIFTEKIPGINQNQIFELSERKEALFRECAKGKISFISGMEDFLKELENSHIKKIIASSTPTSNLSFFLEHTILGKYFNDYVAGDQVAAGKPAPDIFIEAAKKINLLNPQCFVLEDSPPGLKAGYLAKSTVIALSTTHSKEKLSNYHLIYGGPKELSLNNIKRDFVGKL